ncbi:hypothetical protein ISN45_Aa01g027560 [Arabidopsis thaliana x Arabidopsis arenosa]|uniref:DUF223 domain-containing protein n=1 Tax=Arabidopsis thaliana x Arabidopsis arenosa TaxID=1240361 RepID=A0A8T2C3V4_9BRAS|nr:hypothetical protein ISN45_Aa01g027560 [Arabidopsis thaliana x Arabidopsis arenosa]
MAASFAFLRDIRPYKTSWRVQVKVLHSWRQYTNLTGETLELVVADAQGMKIHASIKKDLVSKYVNHLPVNEWRFIETFALNHASGQFRPTGHLYKMSFVTGTTVLRCDPVSDSSYLSLATFPNILNGDLNPYMLIDVMGQVVNIGELETLEANNKPTTKLDFELRDENDERLSCTLWGSFAEQVFNACDAADGARVICLIRFAKIKAYKGVRSISNSFDVTQVLINPPIPEVAAFLTALPADGLALTFRESVPKFQMVTVAKDDAYLQYERKTISELLSSMEIGKVRVVCTIYGIDTDWAWIDLNKDKEKQKEEAIRLGVELSLFVVEAMFLLSDDLRSMLLFCFCLLTYAGKKDYDGPVVGRLVRVIQYVFVTYIKPKNGVYHDDGLSIHVELMKTCPQHFNSGVGGLNSLVSILKNGSVVKSYGFEYYNQEMKKLEEKLRSAKEFSEANGFVRDEIKSNIVHLWKSLFEETPEVINPNKPILFELFRPVRDEDLRRRLASLLI